MLRRRMTGILVCSMLAAAGCEPNNGGGANALTGLALTVDVVADTDVTRMRFQVERVSCAGEAVAPQTIVKEANLADILIPGGIPSLENQPLDGASKHVFADQFLAVPAGCWDVTTTPLAADGAPSKICASASKKQVVVTESKTTEIFLINQCSGSSKGAVDVISALNHPPEILDLSFESSKFGNACQPEIICVTARDPDGDPLELAWTAAGTLSFTGPTVVSTTTNGDGSITRCVSIVPAAAGDYAFTVTAYDQLHAADGSLMRIEDWLAVQGYANPSHASLEFPLHQGNQGCSRTYTLDADFNEGYAFNVNHDPNHNQLQLNKADGIRAYPFVNVAASGRGTVIRIDANTGAILGEYATAPDNMAKNPSRTTVDRWGNVWVTNRDEGGPVTTNGETRSAGSVTRVGLVVGGEKVAGGLKSTAAHPILHNTCWDRNHDGIIQTSLGLADVRPWPNGGNVDLDGGVETAADECIINFTRTSGTNARTVAVDRNNDVWVGGWGNKLHEKLDGTLPSDGNPLTGQPIANTLFLPTDENGGAHGGYGGLVDCHNVLWSADVSGGWTVRFVPNATMPPAGTWTMLTTVGNYGLGVDPRNGHIWHSSYGMFENRLFEMDATGALQPGSGYLPPAGFGNSRGVAVDRRGHVWVAEGDGSKVWHLAPGAGGYVTVGTIPGFSSPTGVAVDYNGKIWVSELGSSQATRIDPSAGPVVGGESLGAIDLVVSLNAPGQVAASPYNYSDMTGYVLLNSTAPTGFWSVVHQGCADDTSWSSVAWTSEEPAGAAISVEVRAANTPVALSTQAWATIVNGQSLAGLTGKFIEVRAVFQRSTDIPGKLDCDPTNPVLAGKPVLYDLTVSCAGN